MTHLLRVSSLGHPVLTALQHHAEVLRAFNAQDSGCVGLEVRDRASGQRFFLKHPTTPRAALGLDNARRIHERVTHPALAGSGDLSGELKRVVERATEREPDLRWPSVESLRCVWRQARHAEPSA